MVTQLYMKDKYEHLWFAFHFWGLTSEGVSARWGFGERRKRRERKKLESSDCTELTSLHSCTAAHFQTFAFLQFLQLHNCTVSQLRICTFAQFAKFLPLCTAAQLQSCIVAEFPLLTSVHSWPNPIGGDAVDTFPKHTLI